MAYGRVETLATNTGKQTFIPAGFNAPSMGFLNPNDGVLYVATNRELTGTNQAAWDYKIPSQSYAVLPGPWRSAGLFYLDQSGAGRNGEVTLYPLNNKMETPYFTAIGRAVAAAQSALDISTGAQPGAPGAGFSRLWVDANDHLHLLPNSGPDRLMIDDETTLGGVLAGTLPNPSHANIAHVFPQSVEATQFIVPTGGIYQGRTAAGALMAMLRPTGDNMTQLQNGPGGQTLFVNSANTTRIGTVDDSGNLAMNGEVRGGSLRSLAGVMLPRGNNIFWGDANSQILDSSGYTYFFQYNTGWRFRNSLNQHDTFLIAANGYISVAEPPGAPPNVSLDVGGSSGVGWGAFVNTGAQSLSGTPGATLWLRSGDGSAGCGGTILMGAAGGMFAGIRGYFIDGSTYGRGNMSFATRINPTDSTLTEQMQIFYNGDIAFGPGAPAVSASRGFPMMPRMGGPPTTAPSDSHGAGWAPFVFDDANRRLYIYSFAAGRWYLVALS